MDDAANTKAAREAVEAAVAELNPTLPAEQRLAVADDTVLLGEGTALDSLTLVNLIVTVEDHIEDAHGLALGLSEQPDLLDPAGPCRTLGGLIAHVATALETEGHG